MDPLHITEFASPRYFDKLKSLNEVADNANVPPPPLNAGPANAQAGTFTLPIGNPRPQPARRRRSDDTARSQEAKKRSLGHDLSSLRVERRPSFALSIASFRNKVSLHHRPTATTTTTHIQHSFVEHDEFIYIEEQVRPQ
jgi:hypothetical protein